MMRPSPELGQRLLEKFGFPTIDRGATPLFNDLGTYRGEAIAVASILRADGQAVTVVGKTVRNPESPYDVEISEVQLPLPPGACKIWYLDREAGQQPRLTLVRTAKIRCRRLPCWSITMARSRSITVLAW